MNETTLKSKLDKLQVTPQDLFRAILYLAQLEHAGAVFAEGLRANKPEGGLGDDYRRVEVALANPVLLTQLAKMLDEYVLYAVIADLISGGKIQKGKDEEETVKNFIAFQQNQDAYRQYFQERIFGVSESHFQRKLTEFYDAYPRTKYAIEKVTTNFINNVTLACKRIITDWDHIDMVFASGQHYELRGLVELKSSGSDFHKGGKQVLFLTFKVFERQKLRYMQLKLIYKPADVEADCLIIGDSAAVNNVRKGFMDKSLMEIFNALIELDQKSNLNSLLIKLPTYKILPCSFGSVDQPPAIKDSYGYLEFLHHEEPKQGSDNPLFSPTTGPGDFVIFPAQQDEGKICDEFYRLIGQLSALACTFSFGDVHHENLIVHQFKPYLIDLENCLIKPMASIKTTGLLMDKKSRDYAAITGIHGQTRLFVDGNPRRRVEPENHVKSIIIGLQQMMELMRANVNHGGLAGWFTRIKKVIVRQVPISTIPLANMLNSLFDYQKCDEPMETFEADITTLFRQFEQDAYGYWLRKLRDLLGGANHTLQSFKALGAARQQVFWKTMIFPDPIFFAVQEAYLKENYRNLDVPVYYHRVGGNDLLDYNGAKIAVGAQLYVTADHYQNFLTYCGDNKGDRNFYFPLSFSFPGQSSSYPTERYIQEWQFAKLADPTYFSVRVKALTDEIVAELQPSSIATTTTVLQQLNVKTANQ